jgi:hypothetical protein
MIGVAPVPDRHPDDHHCYVVSAKQEPEKTRGARPATHPVSLAFGFLSRPNLDSSFPFFCIGDGNNQRVRNPIIARSPRSDEDGSPVLSSVLRLRHHGEGCSVILAGGDRSQLDGLRACPRTAAQTPSLLLKIRADNTHPAELIHAVLVIHHRTFGADLGVGPGNGRDLEPRVLSGLLRDADPVESLVCCSAYYRPRNLARGHSGMRRK